MAKKSRQNYKCLENEESLKLLRAFFIIFTRLSLNQTRHFFGRWKTEFQKSFVFLKDILFIKKNVKVGSKTKNSSFFFLPE